MNRSQGTSQLNSTTLQPQFLPPGSYLPCDVGEEVKWAPFFPSCFWPVFCHSNRKHTRITILLLLLASGLASLRLTHRPSNFRAQLLCQTCFKGKSTQLLCISITDLIKYGLLFLLVTKVFIKKIPYTFSYSVLNNFCLNVMYLW